MNTSVNSYDPAGQFPKPIVYKSSYVAMIRFLDGIIFLIGMAVWLSPFAFGFYPGGYDTTLHVTFGAIIAGLSIFRVLFAYSSGWVEVVLLVFGLFVAMLPKWLSMQWNPSYNGAHLAAGIIVMVLALISGIATFIKNDMKSL